MYVLPGIELIILLTYWQIIPIEIRETKQGRRMSFNNRKWQSIGYSINKDNQGWNMHYQNTNAHRNQGILRQDSCCLGKC